MDIEVQERWMKCRDVEFVNVYSTRFPLDLNPFAGEFVKPAPAHADGRIHRRHLGDFSPKCCDSGLDFRPIGWNILGLADDRAIRVERIGRNAQVNHCAILLVAARYVRTEARIGPQAEDQNARGHGIERARVPDFLDPKAFANPRHHILRRVVGGFVYAQKAVDGDHLCVETVEQLIDSRPVR